MYTQPSRPKSRFLTLELLRFVLSLTVLFYHYYYFGPRTGAVAVKPSNLFVLSFGLFAVEAFFIISGFVITISAAKKTALQFAAARFVRLGPVLLIGSTITFVVLKTYVLPPTPTVKTVEYFHSILVLPLVKMSYLDPSLWSLVQEIRFYIVIAILLLFCSLEARVLYVAGALLAYDYFDLIFGVPSAFKLYLPYFILGMLLFALFYQKRRTPMAYLLIIATLVACSARAIGEYNRVFRSIHLPEVSWWYGVVIAVSVFAVVWFSIISDSFVQLPPVVKLLGAMSYPLYVVHQLLGYWIINLVTLKFKITRFDLRPLVILFMVGLSFVIAKYWEPPLARLYWKVIGATEDLIGLLKEKLQAKRAAFVTTTADAED